MIYDCFIFYDEFLLLEIRLNELSPHVDKFVLVEASHSFSGKPKPFLFENVKNNPTFAPFLDKIIHIKLEMNPKVDRWQNEYDQRNAIAQGLIHAAPDDLIMVSDVDEIINVAEMPLISELTPPTRLQMKSYYYFFNCQANINWFHAAVCRMKDYHTAQFLRNGDYHKLIVLNAGWHFGYLMTPDKIAAKLEAFSHSEFDNEYFKDPERIQNCLDGNADLFARSDMTYTVEPLDAPQYVMKNRKKYANFIKKPQPAQTTPT